MILLVGLVVGTALFGAARFGAGTSKAPQGLLLIEEPQHRAEVKVANRRTNAEDAARQGDQSLCFRNKVMWQPTTCSQLHEIVALLGPQPTTSSSTWSLVYVGSPARIAFKVAEINEVLGDPDHGPEMLGLMLLKTSGHGSQFCGACCECVGKDPASIEGATLLQARAAATGRRTYLVDAGPMEMALPVVQALGPSIEVVPVRVKSHVSASSTRCLSIVRQLASTLSPLQSSIDVLSLDADECDATITRRIVLDRFEEAVSLRPQLLQLTMFNAQENYSTLVASLNEVAGYTCYFHTMKPAHKTFRGIRVPPYPTAVLATDCWRPVYDNFKGERHLLTCHLKSNSRLASIMTKRTRSVHKGAHNGCSSSLRFARLKALIAHGNASVVK